MDITNPLISDYISTHSTPDCFELSAIHNSVRQRFPYHGMMVDPVEGRFLHLLAHLVGAKRVLEIGTFGGYSAAHLASAVGEDGEVITLEISEDHAKAAQENLEKAGIANVKILKGDARQLLKSIEGPFQLIFIDADKTGYPFYFSRALELLDDRGAVVLDNTLQNGKVLSPEDDDSRAIAELNRKIASDPELESVLLPLRDGVTIVLKRHGCTA